LKTPIIVLLAKIVKTQGNTMIIGILVGIYSILALVCIGALFVLRFYKIDMEELFENYARVSPLALFPYSRERYSKYYS
jgi:hypothetical protein